MDDTSPLPRKACAAHDRAGLRLARGVPAPAIRACSRSTRPTRSKRPIASSTTPWSRPRFWPSPGRERRSNTPAKRGGKPSASQPDICGRLIRLARQGKRGPPPQGRRSLRLRPGRRGGPGARRSPHSLPPRARRHPRPAGGLAAAGIPMTHRTTNSAVTLLTGHDAAGGVPDGLDWKAIAQGAPGADLLHGAPPARRHRRAPDPERPPRPRRRWRSSATPPPGPSASWRPRWPRRRAAAERAGVEAPCLVVVGDVVRLRRALDPAASVEAPGRGGRGACPALAPRRRLVFSHPAHAPRLRPDTP